MANLDALKESLGLPTGGTQLENVAAASVPHQPAQPPGNPEAAREFGRSLGKEGAPTQGFLTDLKTAAGLLAAISPSQKKEIIQANFPDAQVFDDKDGVTWVNVQDQNLVLNKPGFSPQDAMDAAFQVLSFIPAAKAASVVPRVLGAISTALALEKGVETAGGTPSRQNVKEAAAFEVLPTALGQVPAVQTVGQFLKEAPGKLARKTKLDEVGRTIFKKLGLTAPAGQLVEESVDEAGNFAFKPTQEFQEQLDKAEIDFTDLDKATVDTLRQLPPGASPEEGARFGAFKDLGIDPVRSSVTQDFAGQQLQRRARRAPGELGDAARIAEARESQGFQDAARRMIDSLGYPDDAGDSIKESLLDLMSSKSATRNAAYKHLASLPGQGVPIAPARILESFQTDKVINRLARQKPEVHVALEDTLVEYGVITDDALVENFLSKKRGQITPLQVENFEEFRQALNDLIAPGNDPRQNSAAKTLKNALDAEIEEVDKFLSTAELGESGSESRAIIEAAKTARALSIDFSRTFKEPDIVNALVKKKRGSFEEEYIKGSLVYNKVVGRAKPGSGSDIATPEEFKKLIGTLGEAGPKGVTALNNMRARMMMDLLDAGTSSKAGKLRGEGGSVIKWSGVNFRNRLDAIGREKIDTLFRGDPKGRNAIANFELASESLTDFAAVAKASGTSDDMYNTIARVPTLARILQGGALAATIGSAVAGGPLVGGGVAAVAGTSARAASKKVTEKAVLKRARADVRAFLDARPKGKGVSRGMKLYGALRRDYPNIPLIFGLRGILGDDDE